MIIYTQNQSQSIIKFWTLTADCTESVLSAESAVQPILRLPVLTADHADDADCAESAQSVEFLLFVLESHCREAQTKYDVGCGKGDHCGANSEGTKGTILLTAPFATPPAEIKIVEGAIACIRMPQGHHTRLWESRCK